MPSDQSKMFDKNFLFLKLFAIYPGRMPSKYYRYYSFVYLFLTLVCYNIFLTVNLLYTPHKIDLLLREVIFYFTEITVTTKVLTVLYLRDKIINTLNFIDCDEFVGDYENKNGILSKFNKSYQLGYKLFAILANFAYSSQIFTPIILDFIRNTKSELPICKYYFLSDEVRESYFILLFIYQSFGMYGHLVYNVNIDSLIAGLLVIAIAQLRVLKNNLINFKLTKEERYLPIELQDRIQFTRLNKLLRHYDIILKFCENVQEIFTTTLFFQFGVASLIICVVMCGLVLPSSMETHVFLVIYLFTMTLEIFVPGFLGTQLTYEGEQLISAAYCAEWIPRSESFKRSMRLLITRASTPIMISGLNMFPLSLITFTSIMKTAYSFFTLIRNVQNA